MTEAGKKTLIDLEGLKTHAYADEAGLSTIGVGHLLTKDELSSGKIRIGETTVDYRDGLTEAQCVQLMEDDLLPASNVVSHCVTVKLNPNQKDALTLFAFNVGTTAFRNSTLLRRLNDGEYSAVPSELQRWIYTAGKVSKGLRDRRRPAEIRLWNTPVPEVTHDAA
jgi:lysozyme